MGINESPVISLDITDASSCPSFAMGSWAGGEFQLVSGDVTSIEWYCSLTESGTYKEAIDPSTGSAITQTVATTGDYAIPYALNGRRWLQPRCASGTSGVLNVALKN